jgi:EmrB/QacA subfamily drug resistance transporter
MVSARSKPHVKEHTMTLDRSRPAWTLALTSVAYFMVALDALVVTTALPAIHRELGGNLSTLDWTVNAYLLLFATGMITAAAVGDRLGRRRVYVAGLVLFTAASAGCALAPSAPVLIAARAIQGAGAAVVTPLSLTILTASAPAHRRGRLIGLWGGIAGLAAAGGPLIGGAVTEGLSWHWIFWVNVPIGVLAAALSVSRLPDSRGPAVRLDLPGLGLVSAGAVGIAWGMIRAADAGWGSTEVLAALGLGAVAAAGLIGWERRTPYPMLPPRLFRIRPFAGAGATSFLLIGTLTSAAFLLAQYYQLGLGYSPWNAGLRFLPWSGMPLLLAPLAGLACERTGPRPVLVTGIFLQGAGLGWLALVATPGAGYGRLVPPLFTAGVGIALALPSAALAALGAVPPADLGTASGVNNTLQRLGGVLAVAAVSAVFAHAGHLGGPAGVTAGFRPALALSAGLSLLGTLTAATVIRRRPPARQPAPEPAVAVPVAS